MSAPRSASSQLLLGGEVLRGEFGVRHQDFAQAHLLGRFDQGENFGAAEVAGGQDHVVAGDEFEAEARLGNYGAALVDHAHAGGRDAHGGQFALDLGPEGQLFVAAGGQARGFVLGIHRGHPDDLRSRASGDLDGHRIEAAHRVVQGDGAERADSGHGLGDHLGPLGGRDVVRFEDEATQPMLQESVARSRSSMRRGITSGATWTCRS